MYWKGMSVLADKNWQHAFEGDFPALGPKMLGEWPELFWVERIH